MVSYINETDFVIENKKLVYPEIVTEGLQLYYDAKGKRDTDYHRDTMLDMSGNKNHGKLHNFAYEKHSGYKDGLVFDYIDDKLVRPTLDLQPDDFTFMLNGNIISFSPDGTVKRVQDGEVIESKGFNMLYDMENTSYYGLDVKYNYNQAQAIWTNKAGNNTFLYSTTKYIYKDKHKYYISYNAKPDGPVRLRIFANERYLDGDILSPILNEYNFRSGILEAENQYDNQFNVRLLFSSDGVVGTKVDIKDLMMIDLTETFGAGNEPTKEQMDEIINRFGFIPNAQDLVDHIEYKGNTLGDMENIIDGLYKTEVLSGEEVYTDKADDSVVHVEVDGKSYQHAGSGKNLITFNPDNFSIIEGKRAVEASGYFNNWSLELPKGVYYTKSNNNPSLISKIDFKENTPYTIQAFRKMITIREGYYAKFQVVYSDGSYTMGSGSTKDEWTNVKLSTDLDKTVSYIVFALGTSTQYALLDIDTLQLEEGSTATDYEPPAPTPDYPVEIYSLNDFDVVSSVGKRNLIKESDGIYTWVGEYNVTNNIGAFVHRPIPHYSAMYQIEVRAIDDSIVGAEFGWQWSGVIRGNSIIISKEWKKVTAYLDVPSALSIGLRVKGGLGRIELRHIKVEEGNKATPYAPSPEDILEDSDPLLVDKINILLDEPLRSVRGVKDRLFRDSAGLWKIERNVEWMNVDDSNVGFYSGYHTENYYSFVIREIAKHTNNIISSHLPRVANVWKTEQSGIYTSAYGTWLQIPKSFVSSVDELKTKGIEIQYESETPTIETLDQGLQDKLNNLRSFEDSNYVYTVLPNEDNYLSNNLKPTLHAKFLYNNWYKEDRVINNLMIYNRALTNEEILQNYKTIKRRWGM